MALATLGVTIPSFVIAAGLMYVFAFQLKWLPVFGVDDWRGYILPMVTSLFVWNGYPPLLNTLGIIIGGISLGVYFFQNLFMLRDTVKKKLDRRVGAIGMFVMGSPARA